MINKLDKVKISDFKKGNPYHEPLSWFMIGQGFKSNDIWLTNWSNKNCYEDKHTEYGWWLKYTINLTIEIDFPTKKLKTEINFPIDLSVEFGTYILYPAPRNLLFNGWCPVKAT